MRQFIDETLHTKCQEGALHGSPPCARHDGVNRSEVDVYVRTRIRRIGAVHFRGVLRILQTFRRVEHGTNGRTSNAMRPGREFSLFVEAACQAVVSIFPVKVMLNVIFACPEQLNRLLDFARYLPSLSSIIPLCAAPERSTRERHV